MRSTTVILALLVGCGSTPPTTGDADPLRANGSPAATGAGQPAFVAVVAPRRVQILPAPFAGSVATVAVRPGQRVRAGDVVARQDTASIAAQLAQARAEQSSARAQVERATLTATAQQRELSVQRKLAQLGVAPVMAVENETAKLRDANAEISVQKHLADARTAQVDALQAKLDRSTITAPFDGVIAAIMVKPGESVGEGAAVARIVDSSSLVVRFAVPASDEIDLALGTSVELALPNRAPVAAVVTDIRDDIEPPSSFRIVEAELRDPAPKLRISAVGRVTLAN